MSAEIALSALSGNCEDTANHTTQKQNIASSESDTNTIIQTPTSTDVLCGRGAPAIKHTGNRTFRTLVKINKPLHSVCDKKERYRLAESIVKALERHQTPPTRFLEKYPGGEDTTKWVPISKERAIRKALQALREKESEYDDDDEESSSPDELIEILSGEYFSKKSFFLEQDNDESYSDWNNVVRHLLPRPLNHESLSIAASHSTSLPASSTESCDNDYSVEHNKKRKTTSLGPTTISSSSPGNFFNNVASSHRPTKECSSATKREELYNDITTDSDDTRPDKSSKQQLLVWDEDQIKICNKEDQHQLLDIEDSSYLGNYCNNNVVVASSHRPTKECSSATKREELYNDTTADSDNIADKSSKLLVCWEDQILLSNKEEDHLHQQLLLADMDADEEMIWMEEER